MKKNQSDVEIYKPSALCGFRMDIRDNRDGSLIKVNLNENSRSRMVNTLKRLLGVEPNTYHTDRYGNHLISKTMIYITDEFWDDKIHERICVDLGLIDAEYPARWEVLIRELRISNQGLPEEPVVVRVSFEKVKDAYSYIRHNFPNLEKVYDEMVSDQYRVVISD